MSEDTIVTGSIDDSIREILAGDAAQATPYLRAAWLVGTSGALRSARRAAGLTQQQVADRIGTTQPYIARIERDKTGSMSLRRFIDYALACELIPDTTALISLEDAAATARGDLDAASIPSSS